MKTPVILSAARLPTGRFLGALKSLQATELGALAVRAAVARAGVDPAAVALGREHGLTVIDGGCPCMYSPTADPGHRAMKAVLTLTGRVPRRV